MNIGEQLKKLRENNGMTRKDAADKLKELGIDISDKTLYGYESGRNSANADMFLALCRIYKCNNVMETFSDSVSDVLFTNEEWEIIEKYRDLDDHGKEMVDLVLDKEHARMTSSKVVYMPLKKERVSIVADELIPYGAETLNAAHERTDIEVTDEMRQHDNALMMDDKLWE